MNIAYIMRYWPVYGGGETITVTLANELVRRGHSVHVIYTYDQSCSPMPYNIDNRIVSYKVHTIEHYTKKDVKEVHNYITRHAIEVMVNQWGCTELCDKARHGTVCKLVTCWHLDVIRKFDKPIGWKKKLIFFLLGERLYQRYAGLCQMREHDKNCRLSDKYVFLSDSFLTEYVGLSHMKGRTEKVAAIANPLTYDYRYDMSDYGFKEKEVLYVGRIYEYHKRLSYVLKIWSKIEGMSSCREWRLTIVGDGPDMQQTKSLAEKLRLQRVSFEGFKDPRPYYQRASLFMMTSAFEGFGMTLVEAQQYGVVPLAMDTYGSLHDIIADGQNGEIIADNDLDEYARKLRILMENSEKRKQMAMNGMESCLNFSLPVICGKWERLFSQIIKS